MANDFTTRGEVIDVYRRRAANYDITANLYYLIGLREHAYRRRRPWDSIRRHLRNVTITEHYFGIIYLAVGEK